MSQCSVLFGRKGEKKANRPCPHTAEINYSAAATYTTKPNNTIVLVTYVSLSTSMHDTGLMSLESRFFVLNSPIKHVCVVQDSF